MQRLFILFILVLPCNQIYSQENRDVPKNFPGLYSALVFDQISIAVGVEYERYLFVRSKFALGARVGHLFKYKNGNANFISGSDDNVTSSNWQLWTGGYWFTSVNKDVEGFFINASFGINYTKSEERVMISPPASTIIKGEGFSPAVEAGVGIQFSVGSGMVIRLGGFGAVCFPSADDKSFSPKNTLSLRASVGF